MKGAEVKTLFRKLILLALVATTAACANRYRDASTGRSGDEVGQLLSQLQSSSQGGSGNLQQVINMIEQPGTAVYFAEAPGAMGPIHAVLPIDLSYLISPQVGAQPVSELRAWFIDQIDGDFHRNALVIQYVTSQGSGFEVFMDDAGAPGFIDEDGVFEVALRGSNNQLVLLTSFDADGELNELNDVIQLELSQLDQLGNVVGNAGQISSMEGFF